MAVEHPINQGGNTGAFGRYPDYTRQRILDLAGRLAGLVYPETLPASSMQVAGPVDRITHAEAMALDYRPVALGESFGPLWSTFWFRLALDVPDAWAGRRVDLRWNAHSEALLWIDGRSVQGLNATHGIHDTGRFDAVLFDPATGGEHLDVMIEMACNGMYGLDQQMGYGRQSRDTRGLYWLETCGLGRFDPEAWDLYHDYRLLAELLGSYLSAGEVTNGKALAGVADPAWTGHLFYELNRFCNLFKAADRATWEPARAILRELLKARNGTIAHRLSAIGHAHLDTAWLWPLAETHRKCQRTFSSMATYMDRYPEFKFACSQACQYEAMEQINPDLFERIRARVARGQWIPVGGSWVEPDCNLPSGESLCRQFLYGQRYFEKAFGRRSTVFWNPDVFGYNGQLPQIMREAGLTRFLTQKLSWNRFTKPMHHTFYWRGIDGSEVLAHFPPADSYNGRADVDEIRYHVANYKDSDRSADAYYLFGRGDGGGGPTTHMIERFRRLADLQGMPRCAYRTPDEFFTQLEEQAREIPVISGELYFELHRGTYTTQAEMKRLNRRAESLLHDLEFLDVAARQAGAPGVDRETLRRMWKLVLVNQFHDILPGTSIGEVYARGREELGRVCRDAAAMVNETAAAWAGGGEADVPLNTLGFARREVTRDPQGAWTCVEAPAYGAGETVTCQDTVRVTETRDGYLLQNRYLRAEFNQGGQLVSLVDAASGRESLAGPGNRFLLYEDQPVFWDAWDIDPFALETERPAGPALEHAIASRAPLHGALAFAWALGEKSRLRVTAELAAESRHLAFACEADWHERDTLLKVAFPVQARADEATYEMPFGCVARPTHANTPADVARYECPGHRWVDLSEHGFGVALLSDCKYGYAVRDRVMSISLLRGPTYPDPEADIGVHRFRYAVFPHAGDWREAGVVAEGARFNAPLVWTRGPADLPRRSLFSVDDPLVVIDTVKRAEDGDAVVVRLYEAGGGRREARLETSLDVRTARRSNILEEDVEPLPVRDGVISLALSPFQLLTLKVEC